MSLNHVQVHLVDDIDTAAAAARWLSTRETIALDTETTGLDTHRDRVRTVQLGDPDVAWVFPVELPRSWGGIVLELLERYTGRVICHNLKYDHAMVANTLGHRLDTSRVDDTMLMSRVLEPTRSAALKRLAGQLVDPRARVMDAELADAMRSSGYDWRTVPVDFSTYWFYAGVDTVLTHRVYDVLKPRLDASGTTAYPLELAASLVCGRMEDHGVKIDVPFAREYFGKLMRYVDETGAWCESTYGVKPGSNAGVVQVLEDAGHTFIKLTKGGAIALDKEVLSTVDHPLAHAVLQRRQAQKVASTYLRHFIEEVDGDDRIHPRINSCEARTSRMSMDSPNLQNLPRRSDANPLAQIVRNCVIPAEGHVLLMADFDQVEMRLFASLSRDPDLIAAFEADDFFTEMCRGVFADPSIQRDDPRRQTTKNSMYARIYGAGTDKFALTAGITVEEARRFNAMLDHRYPAIRGLQQRIDLEARDRLSREDTAYVTSPLTHRRFVIDDDTTYRLMNYLCQGVAAEILKMKLIELTQVGLERYMVVPVHDECILEVPLDDLVEVAHAVHDVMNDTTLFQVPITASLATGSRWGAKVSYVLPT